MAKTDLEMYDAIIIGAGIGGLVCGCYLAKSGMKVLVAEQHTRPGGYCTSFQRQGFTFDAGPHCFGSYRKGGMTRKILEELDVNDSLTILRPDPSDVIVTPEHHIPVWNSLERTLEQLQAVFPDERANIKSFFSTLLDTNPQSFSRLRKATFKEILDQYFSNAKLKATLGFPLLAVNGLPPSLLSAFVGAKLYSEFIIDGGYYPLGGMQALPDVIAHKFASHGGELRLSTRIKRIKTDKARAVGVVLHDGTIALARTIISNIDARQTFLNLLGKESIPSDFYHALINMVPSLSNFIVYLGVDSRFRPVQNPGTAYHYFSHYNVERAYRAVKTGDFSGYGGYALRIAHDRSTIYAGMPAPYKSKSYWTRNKHSTMTSFIDHIQETAIQNASSHIMYRDAASPQTMHRYTLNYHGAAYGWASIPAQLIVPGFRKPSFIQGLYLVGHWTTHGVGVSGSAYVGYDTARNILRGKEHSKNAHFLL